MDSSTGDLAGLGFLEQGQMPRAKPDEPEKPQRVRKISVKPVEKLDARAKDLLKRQRTKKKLSVTVNLIAYEQIIDLGERYDRTVNQVATELALYGLLAHREHDIPLGADGHTRLMEALPDLQEMPEEATFGKTWAEAVRQNDSARDAAELRQSMRGLLPASPRPRGQAPPPSNAFEEPSPDEAVNE